MHPERPSDPERRTGELPGGRFTYTDEGEGEVLVAVHGAPGSARDFRWLGAALPSSLRFLRLEMPGFGGTPRSTEPRVDVDSRARFVVSALDALEIGDFAIVGHSMGGPVAVAVARRADERCRALALLSSAGLRPHRLLRRSFGLHLVARLLDRPLLGPPLTALVAAFMRQAGFPASTPRAEFAHATRCVAAVDFEQQRVNARELRQETLLAWAEDDPLIEAAIFEEHAAVLPPGPRCVWAKGGHNIQKTHASELAEALTKLCRAENA